MIKRLLITLLALVLCINPYSTVAMAKDDGGGSTDSNFERNTESIDLPTPVLKVAFDDETVTDSSPSNITAEVVGTTEYVDGVNGGKAIYFKNPSDANKVAEQYVNFGQPDALKFGTDSFTTVFWYKTASDSKLESSIISNKDWYTGNNPGFNIGNMAQGVNFNFNALGHSGRAETDRFSSTKDNQWHHIAAVVDRRGGKMTFYIDGKPAKGGAGFGSNSSTVDISKHTGSIDVADFVLGADGVHHKYGLNNAAVDQLAVYKAALTPDQIGQIINSESGNIHIQQEITNLRVKVESLIIGNRYEKVAVEALIDKLIKVEEMVTDLPFEEANRILNTVREDYQNLMKGNGKEKISFHLISDTHVGSGSAAANLSAALTDMKNINPDAAALVTAGDNTQDGKPSEKMELYNLIKDKKPFKDNNALITLGNHDVRGPSGALIVDPVTGKTVRNVWQSVPDENNTYWNTAYKLYMENNAVYMPADTTTTYFDRWIEGYHFLILNPENSAKDTAWMTQDQLDWLDEKLSENEDPTKPIFVLAHQGLNDTHRQSNVNNGFGPQDKAVKAILEKHPQVVFISGHAHNGLGVVEAMQRSYGVLIDIPSFSQVWNGDKSNGSGYEVYVYEDEIYFSARNFVTQQWLPEHDISIKLPGLPVTYQKANKLTKENFKDSNLWDALQDAKKEAKMLINKEYDLDELVNNTPGPKLYGPDTQKKIKEVQTALQIAIDSAMPALDKTALVTAIAKAEEKVESGFTTESWKVFSEALRAAKAVNEDADATQVEVDSALEALTDAQTKLVENPSTDDITAPEMDVMMNGRVVKNEVTVADSETIAFTWGVTDEGSGVAKVLTTFDDEAYEEGTTLDMAGNPGQHELIVTAVDNVGNVAVKTYVIHVTTSAADMQMLIERFKKAGEFENDSAARALRMHMTAVEQYEKNESADKVVKHMQSFKVLLDNQKQKMLISEKAYTILKADANYILQKW